MNARCSFQPVFLLRHFVRCESISQHIAGEVELMITGPVKRAGRGINLYTRAGFAC